MQIKLTFPDHNSSPALYKSGASLRNNAPRLHGERCFSTMHRIYDGDPRTKKQKKQKMIWRDAESNSEPLDYVTLELAARLDGRDE